MSLKNRLRISITTLDSYLYYLNSEMSKEEFIERLHQKFVPSPAMEFGTAYHRLIENGWELSNRLFVEDHYSFTIRPELAEPALALRAHHRKQLQGINEVKTYKDYGDVRVVARIDRLSGLHIEEHKTTGYYIPEKYEKSYQWRFYVDITETDGGCYNIFELKGYTSPAQTVQDFANCIKSISYHKLSFERYGSISIDCKNLVEEFKDFIYTNRLEHLYLTNDN